VDVAKTLSEARRALETGKPEQALAKLLVAWRAVRHPRIADLVDLVSEDVTAKREPIKGKTGAARTAAWQTVEEKRDAADLGRLLATPWPGTWQLALPLLRRLREWPDDPRMAMAFARIVDETPFTTSSSRNFYRPLFAELEELRDLRTLPLLRDQLAKTKPTYYVRAMRSLEESAVEALEGTPPAIAKPVEQVIAALEARYADRIARAKDVVLGEQEHWAAILAEPGDLAPRAVYADWLQEKGDPRGEFIALQLAREAGQATEAAEARERKLLAEHGRAWAGTLDQYFEEDGRRFEHGLFAGGELRRLDDRAHDTIFADPAWRLISVLAVSRFDEPAAVIDRPELVSLRAVECDEPAAVAIAGGRKRRFTELTVHIDRGESPDRAALAACKALPELRTLGVTLTRESAEWLAKSPVLERIDRLVVKVVADLRRFLAAVAKAKGTLRELVITTGRGQFATPESWILTLRRETAPGPFTSLVARYRSGKHTSPQNLVWNLASALGEIPTTWLRTIDIDAGRKLNLESSDRASLGKLVAAFSNLETAKVPWEAPVKQKRAKTGRSYRVRVEGPSLLDTRYIGPLWRLVVGDLAQTYEGYKVGYNGGWRPIDGDAFTRAKKWAANRRTSFLELRNDGRPGQLALTRNGGSIESTEVTLVEIERSPNELVDWFARFVDLAELQLGVFDLEPERFEHGGFSLGLPAYSGWLTFIGGQLAKALPVKEVAKLATRKELAGMFARKTKHGLLVGAAADPETVDKKRLRALGLAMKPILAAHLAKRLGYDLTERTRAVLEPVARKLGLKFDDTASDPMTVVFVKRPELRLMVTLSHVFHSPGISIELTSGPPDNLSARKDLIDGCLSAETRAQFDQLLATAAKAAHAEAAAWFTEARRR
jgi:uncharacterized protein (TIGR02996 family)